MARTGTFDHPDQGAVVDATDFLVVVLVAVSLEDSQDLFGVFQYFSNRGGILDPVDITDIQSLVCEDDSLLRRGLQVGPQPIEFGHGNVGVGPFKVLSPIGLSVGSKARIQHDEVEVSGVKRVVRFLLLDGFKEFLFRQRVDSVIAQHVVPILTDHRKIPIDPLQVTQFDLHRISRVDEVTQFHEKSGLVLAEFGGSLCQLGGCFAVVPRSRGRLVGVMEGGDEAELQRRSFVTTDCCPRNDGGTGQHKHSIFQECPAAQTLHGCVGRVHGVGFWWKAGGCAAGRQCNLLGGFA